MAGMYPGLAWPGQHLLDLTQWNSQTVTVTDCWIVPLNDRIVFSSVPGKHWSIIKQELTGGWLEVEQEQQTITNYKSSVLSWSEFLSVALSSSPAPPVSGGPQQVPSVVVSWRRGE